MVAELDQDTAQAFHSVAKIRHGETIPVFDADKEYAKYLDLEIAGLLNFGGGSIHLRISSNEKGDMIVGGDRGERYLMVVKPKPEVKTCTIPCLRLTRVGNQIASIFDTDELAALKIIYERIKGSVLGASVYPITRSPDGRTIVSQTPTMVLGLGEQ